MTDPTEIARVAAGLTRAQRAIVGGECRDIGNPKTWFLVWPEYREKRNQRTFAALTRVGVIEQTRFGPTSLTETGLAVRDHILREKSGG